LTCFFIFSVFFIVQAVAQREVKDSLISLLESGITGEKRVDALNELSYQYFDFNDSIAAYYAGQALTLATEIDYPKGLKFAYTMVGMGYASKSMHRWAILNYRKSHAVKANDADGITVYNLNLLGNTFRDQAMFDSARISYQLAIRNFGKAEKYRLATLYKNLAYLRILLWENKEGLAYLDSAMVILKDNPNPYLKLDIESAYGEAYNNLGQFDQSEVYFSSMCASADDLQDSYHSIKCLINKTELDSKRGNFPKALTYAIEALELTNTYSYPPQQVKLLTEIGIIYLKMTEYDIANRYFFQGLKISEQHNLIYETARIYIQLAWIYKDQGNYKLGLDYADQAETICRRIGDRYGVASCHNVRGLIFYLQKKYTESIQEHNEARQIRQEIQYREGIAASIFNMSLVYVDQQNIDKALSLQKEAIAIEERIGNAFSMGISYNSIAELLIKKGRMDEAEFYLKKTYLLATQTQSKLLMRNNVMYFADLYEAKHDYKKALEYRKQYQVLNDTIYSATSAGKLAEMQALYQLEKKDQQIKLLNNEKALQESQLEVQDERLKFQFLIIASATIGLTLVSLVLFITYRNARSMRKLNREISEQNEEIQAQSEELAESNHSLTLLNSQVIEKNEEIQAQSEELTEANQTISQINRSLEDKVEERTTELKQAYKELDTFFYRASHDFRRPLTTFMGLAEVAKITIKDPNPLELFSKVNDTAHNLDKMLVKLQSISDVGGQELVYKEVFLKDIFDTVCDGFRESLQRKNIKTVCEIELKGAFYSYPALLRIIIENLVENSISFSGQSDPFIRFKAYSSGGEVVMEVQDNGEGIPEEFLGRMFEMYFRANERSKGNGLGLYIVRKAVDKLGGVITVSSELHQGTSFFIRFSGKHL
ncbi:MAG TPA: tetratricopeptide repeat protein, partial [Cyclobacteriaceae bacterium]|nr:tetratricopeptide repeat protein [Cyclobacteriaceae bacterium]